MRAFLWVFVRILYPLLILLHTTPLSRKHALKATGSSLAYACHFTFKYCAMTQPALTSDLCHTQTPMQQPFFNHHKAFLKIPTSSDHSSNLPVIASDTAIAQPPSPWTTTPHFGTSSDEKACSWSGRVMESLTPNYSRSSVAYPGAEQIKPFPAVMDSSPVFEGIGLTIDSSGLGLCQELRLGLISARVQQNLAYSESSCV